MRPALLPFLFASAAFPFAAAAEYTLHILHTNDFHSRIEAVNAFNSTCSAEDAAGGRCFGGIARLVTAVAEKRAALAGRNVLLLDAGDQFQGSLFFTTYGGGLLAGFMQDLGYDAMALGNHEFNDGPEGLAAFLDGVTFPVIAGNIDVGGSEVLAGRVQDHVVLEVGGARIGIVSALTTDTPEISSPGPTVVFRDDIESLRADVAALAARGVTKIIALTHVGYARDIEIAAAVPGIDAVIGGHSHSFLSATDPARSGPYPTWASGADGRLVPVVQAWAHGRVLGHLELTFDAAGDLIFAGGNALPLDAAVAEDAATLARVAGLAGPIEALRARVVGESAAAIEGSREVCRQQECAMGNLVAEAMLARVADQGVTVAIQNGGGLRAGIDAGPVSMGEVLTVLPFQNTLATFTVTGAAIVAALENGVSDVENGAGRFPQVAGLRFAFDPAAPPGARVSDVQVTAGGGGWGPIDPAADYLVVSNNFVRGGGDGFGMFADARNAYDFGPDLADVVADYLAAQSPYAPFTDGRITRK